MRFSTRPTKQSPLPCAKRGGEGWVRGAFPGNRPWCARHRDLSPLPCAKRGGEGWVRGALQATVPGTATSPAIHGRSLGSASCASTQLASNPASPPTSSEKRGSDRRALRARHRCLSPLPCAKRGGEGWVRGALQATVPGTATSPAIHGRSLGSASCASTQLASNPASPPTASEERGSDRRALRARQGYSIGAGL
jgi:hypothetical protein